MGVLAWNQWRREHVSVVPDLRAADLRQFDLCDGQMASANFSRANLTFANLTRANFIQANLEETNFTWATLTGANFTQANLRSANLFKCWLPGAVFQQANLSSASFILANLKRSNLERANLHEANLTEAGLKDVVAREGVFRFTRLAGACLVGADFSGADFTHADLTLADLTDADLTGARISNAIMTGAILNGARVVGVAGWDADLHLTQQRDLVVTPKGRTRVTVDGLAAAQFVLLLLQHPGLRELAHPIRSTAALVLGDFEGERSAVRDAIAETLREAGYTPITLYVRPDATGDLGATVRAVIPIVRFACVDLTGPVLIRSLLEELSWGGVPVQPLVSGMSENIRLAPLPRSRRMLSVHPYESALALRAKLVSTLLPHIKKTL
jgi:uncharacterized protein YjbI with pentapeptide repeats